MKTKFILVSLLVIMVFSACNTEERKKAEAARIVAEMQAEVARIEASTEAEVDRIAAVVEAEAKAAHQGIFAEYEELMLDHYYSYDGYDIGDIMFALPDANCEGVGVHRYGYGYCIFLYKIKDNGRIAIDYGKESYTFYTAETSDDVNGRWYTYYEDGNLCYTESYDKEFPPYLNGKYRMAESCREWSKAEADFYFDRQLKYYDRKKGESYFCDKKYDEERYQEAMQLIKDCLPKAKEVMKR
jgi:hypothetical protein